MIKHLLFHYFVHFVAAFGIRALNATRDLPLTRPHRCEHKILDSMLTDNIKATLGIDFAQYLMTAVTVWNTQALSAREVFTTSTANEKVCIKPCM